MVCQTQGSVQFDNKYVASAKMSVFKKMWRYVFLLFFLIRVDNADEEKKGEYLKVCPEKWNKM